ncbi:hypothetical protein Q8H44_13805, partial [Acinetobacter lwoffii]|uniref:hypothetical protein n=2 Tax=Acinetobacter TaxID=469 RepID=UPI0021CD1C97
LSSRGLGHRPFTAVTGVRIPVGTPYSRWQHLNKKPEHCDSGFFYLANFISENFKPCFYHSFKSSSLSGGCHPILNFTICIVLTFLCIEISVHFHLKQYTNKLEQKFNTLLLEGTLR